MGYYGIGLGMPVLVFHHKPCWHKSRREWGGYRWEQEWRVRQELAPIRELRVNHLLMPGSMLDIGIKMYMWPDP